MIPLAAALAATIALAVAILWVDWRLTTRDMTPEDREDYKLKTILTAWKGEMK